MKKQLIAATLGLSALLGIAQASPGPGNRFFDTAKVLTADPIYETVTISRPEERCWNERVRRQGKRHDSYTGTIAGGIIGGVVGNQFGKGHGRDAMTVAGALLGASVGHDISRQPRRDYTVSERRCEVIDNSEEREEIVGYRVEYRYKGNIFWTRTREYPGKRIRVRVTVHPANGY